MLDLQSSVTRIQVFAAGFEAQYNIANAQTASVSGSERNRLANSSSQASQICNDIELDKMVTYDPSLQQSPSYVFSVCRTPIVNSVSQAINEITR